MFECDDEFSELIRRMRSGEAAAAAELVRRYEPQIRLNVRTWLRLRNPELRRVFDSMDVCQSILADFFVRSTAGQYDLNDPGQLLNLLSTMARNKLRDYVKHQQRRRRDIRRNEGISSGGIAEAREDPPSQQVACEELRVEIQKRLTEEERQISAQRSSGRDWGAIATELGGTAEGRRKQLARAINRVMREFGLGGEARNGS